ncbi:MAG: transporter ATP-binding protein [Herbinix sp.]|jgi:ABC-2 type transport system ATP-binding protein|nr:transporter ATP-binding protein [Herbinix sp.]
MLIEIKEVSKSFKKQQVLKDINLTIDENEIFGLIGPSGAGKTTLIRLLIGAINTDSGTIRVGDYMVPNLKALNNIGYMPQNEALYTDLSGYDNLMFFGGMYQQKKSELKKRADEVLKLVELDGDGNKRVINYSGGMKKRLSLAVALIHSPKVLVLDEPTVGIDPILRKKIWDEFYKLKEQGKTIVVTTHVMDEAIRCDRLALINYGNIIACDTVETLLGRTQNNSIEELFFEKGGQEQ